MGGKKLRRTGFICATLLILAAVGIYLNTPQEPAYEGRTLSQWISNAETAANNASGAPWEDSEWQRASLALRKLDTNAIPWLLKWASARNPQIKEASLSWINSHALLGHRFHFQTAADRHHAAMVGFQCLGSDARPAWPVLIQLTTNKDPAIVASGVRCLIVARADNETLLPVLLRAYGDKDTNVQGCAVVPLHLLYPQQAEAVGVNARYPFLAKMASPGTNSSRVFFK